MSASASTSATRYGSTFHSSATAAFSVDARPPAVTVAAATAPPGAHTVEFAWGATDDSPVTRFDIESSINGGPFSPWLTATPETSGQLAAVPGNRYRVRVRATDEFGNTSEFEQLRAQVQRDNQLPVVIQARTNRSLAYLRHPHLPTRLTTGRRARLSSRQS